MLTPRSSSTSRNRPTLPGKRLSYAFAGAFLAATAALTGLPGQAFAAPLNHEQSHVQERSAPLTYGQDVSNYQPQHDWETSPAQFGIIKATEGTTFRDAAFARHWQALAKKGIVRGAYHYGHPANDPIAEADHFLSVVNSQPAAPGDLLTLDLETTDGRSVAEVNAWAKTWLSYVKAKTGVAPMFYSGWNFADTYGKGLAEYPLWVAHYSKPRGTVTPPADWKTWTIHQYTETPIDENVSALTPDELRALGRPAR
ncbi:hypothetical protein GCM10009677_03260 [Sphaerisporangium rubeum]|uniref:GH25 family lysozyme M1 (1,4-beta-N-acetylmuramidase) n=1 Tax=Sphaerisporangium rubeum TaxID=321317 RepID=A0A7X0IGI9_9ACTN|nr:GH25 family lysozyme [Sphaerisporangium rubeum]MBB6473277.1 GH25 family lysozyme M1 (1,4-beta-N-acetylmuramidase) [Sphaerisporangium rubeum]